MVWSFVRGAIAHGFSQFGWVAVFFVTHPALLVLSLLPAGLRAYQMKGGGAPLALEIAVESSRVLIAVLAVYYANGKPGPLFSLDTWSTIWKTILPRTSAMRPEDWMLAGAGYALVMALLFPLGEALERIPHPDAAAIVFFVKNMTIIPLTLLFVLRLIRWI